uniref:NADH-ubiquinone oxidoreductase chain 4 n=1 Tax=Gonatodes albogularis TaxID=460622 RepID=A0A1Y1CCM8_GONAL|nr:NADH dehydrogenase subunit 4 [Gonatodes albogularis]BAX77893.1 NADH dehydrogenase subunit 4 [Gonatodes albogularis]
MLKIILATFMLAPTALLLPPTHLFSTMTALTSIITLAMTPWAYTSTPTHISTWLVLDHISAPLCLLSAWLLPLMIIASQHHLRADPLPRKRLFLMACSLLQTTLLLTFTANNLLLFYIMFEATLIPTLVLITRWGSQPERLVAGTYFLFYTLAGSLPLLIAILMLYQDNQTLLPIPHTALLMTTASTTTKAFWLTSIAAFLIKMPLYTTHLWLPKAHVEAPIAGSMVLAAVLLKLGGYGLIRMVPLMGPTAQSFYLPFIALALWGMVMTSMICLRQTDLKAIIAYSSVSHMGLVTAAALIQTPWSISGAMMLMVAHGLTSSMLFCLANTSYERTHTRTLLVARGMQLVTPLMTLWWFLASMMNMALPPTINLVGELTIITSTFNWTNTTIALTGLTTMITAIYSLYVFLTTQHAKPPANQTFPPATTREHLLLTLHLVPLVLLILSPSLVTLPS